MIHYITKDTLLLLHVSWTMDTFYPAQAAGCALPAPLPPAVTLQHPPCRLGLAAVSGAGIMLLFRVLVQFTSNKAALAIARELQVEAHADAAAAAARRVLQPRLL